MGADAARPAERRGGYPFNSQPRGGEAQAWMLLEASAVVALSCQRCVQPVRESLQFSRWFRFVRDEAEAAELDADSEDEVLALTRALDLQERGFPVSSLAELEEQIAERDQRDSSREVAPLCMAADAQELVTDGMAIEAVIQSLVDLFRQRVPEDAWPEPRDL
jgi:hypothetical protein